MKLPKSKFLNALTDNALMLAVKEGKVDKLGLLYERHKKWVFNFFMQMNSNRDLSEDLVQNVFMRMLKYKNTYNEESKFVTWMFQIARNVSHDHFRKNEKYRTTEDMDRVSYKLGQTDSIEQTIEHNESKRLLHTALQQLPTDKREVLVLSKLKELKYKEVGTIIGCSEDAARTKAHRALKDLKQIYINMQNNSYGY
jgi:RNA polymerase sigma-70 factor (ECF subfamily)